MKSPRRRIICRACCKAQYERGDASPQLDQGVRLQERASKCRGIEKIVLNMGVGEAVNDTKKVTSRRQATSR